MYCEGEIVSGDEGAAWISTTVEGTTGDTTKLWFSICLSGQTSVFSCSISIGEGRGGETDEQAELSVVLAKNFIASLYVGNDP